MRLKGIHFNMKGLRDYAGLMMLFLLQQTLFAQAKPSVLQKEIEAEIQMSQVTLNTIEKSIAETQERFLGIDSDLNRERELLQELLAKKKKDESTTSKASHIEKQRLLEQIQLALADSDSLESVAEQKILLDQYKSLVEKENNEKTGDDLLQRHILALNAKISQIEVLKKSVLSELKSKQNQKIEIVSQMELNRLSSQKLSDEVVFNDVIDSRKSKESQNDQKKSMFIEPITGYIKYDREDHGLAFECLDKCEIKSPATGIVVYKGELSPYGHIVMIAHTSDFRSVFLGDIDFKLKQSQKVYQGDLIGTASREPIARVYFELRKKSEPQDIFNYIPFY